MKARRFILVSLVLWAALAVHYLPLIFQEGGITFGLIQDITAIYGFYPWDTFSLRELKAGYFPLWNPHNALGEPHLANMQTAVFYPLTWLKFVFSMHLPALDFILLLRLYLAGLFTYLFVRRLGAGVAASLVSALSFMLTGYFTRHIYMSHLNVEVLLPLVMLTFNELARRGGAKWFAAAAATTWLAVVGGFPEATYYTLALGALHFLWTAPLSRWPLLFGAGAVGIMGSAAQALPFIEYVNRAWFYHPTGIGAAHLDIKYFFTLWAPWFFGTNEVSLPAPFLVPYLGLAPVALAAAALRSGGGGRRWFFVVITTVCLGLIYGIPPFSWLGLMPPLDITINYKYAIPPLAFCVTVLAGMGAEDLLEGKSGRNVAITAATLAAVILIAVFFDSVSVFAPFHRAADWGNFAGVLFRSVFLIFIAVIAVKRQKGVAALLLVILAGALPVGGNRSRYDDAVKVAIDSPETAYLVARKGQGRFSAQDHILFPDINLILGVDDLRYYNPMYTGVYADYIKRGNRIKDDPALRRHFADHAMLAPNQVALTDRRWDSANLRWWIGEGPPGVIDLLPDMISQGSWKTRQQGMVGRETFEAAGLRRPALLAHAPVKAWINIQIPENASLKFRPLLRNGAGTCTDGVAFTVIADDGTEKRAVFSMFVDSDGAGETERTVSLSGYAQKDVTLIFVTTPGPQNDSNCDWSGWVGMTSGDMQPEGWRRVEELDRVWERTESTGWGRMEGDCNDTAVRVVRANSQSFKVESPLCRQGRAVVGYAAYPGWRAFSPAGEEKIGAWSDVFQSLEGGGDFQLVYKPSSFRIGLWVSISSLVIWLIFLSLAYNSPMAAASQESEPGAPSS